MSGDRHYNNGRNQPVWNRLKDFMNISGKCAKSNKLHMENNKWPSRDGKARDCFFFSWRWRRLGWRTHSEEVDIYIYNYIYIYWKILEIYRKTYWKEVRHVMDAWTETRVYTKSESMKGEVKNEEPQPELEDLKTKIAGTVGSLPENTQRCPPRKST